MKAGGTRAAAAPENRDGALVIDGQVPRGSDREDAVLSKYRK